jgi:hypothetical protein
MEKIPAIRITITRAEGPIEDCNVPKTFEGPTCWEEANAWMLRQSHSFPADGTCDKHDLEIVFADAGVFKDQLSCERDPDTWDLPRHLRRVMEFQAGMRCPAHWNEQLYQSFLERFERRNPGMMQRSKDFLAKYQIGNS